MTAGVHTIFLQYNMMTLPCKMKPRFTNVSCVKKKIMYALDRDMCKGTRAGTRYKKTEGNSIHKQMSKHEEHNKKAHQLRDSDTARLSRLQQPSDQGPWLSVVTRGTSHMNCFQECFVSQMRVCGVILSVPLPLASTSLFGLGKSWIHSAWRTANSATK